MFQPTLSHYVFVHRFVEAITWQPLRQALATRPSARATVAREEPSAWVHAPQRAA
jgi:hypothetical protein